MGKSGRGMILSLKHDVRIHGLGTEILLGIMIVKSVMDLHGIETVITSAIDGKHSRGSLHYTGDAVDIRISNIPKDKRGMIRDQIKIALGSDFDFILESNHYHMEFQPKVSYNA
jgi:hypothetical protein